MSEPAHDEDEWLWGWDDTPGIVSVWATASGEATIWRRNTASGELIREEARFQPWILLSNPDDLKTLGRVDYQELHPPGELRYLTFTGRRTQSFRELGQDRVLALPPEEQYLVSTGRNYFRDLTFDHLRRMQFDLETTGLHPERDRIFMIAVRYPSGATEVLEAYDESDRAEGDLIQQLLNRVKEADPDVIENHNLHGFDLPFLNRRAARLGIPLSLGRTGPAGLRRRAARRGSAQEGSGDTRYRIRFMAPGRELIDTLDAVLRFDFATRELPSHGLKAVARHLGIAKEDRELIPGAEIYNVYRTDAARVRRYATSDVEEVAELSRMLSGAAFALARMAPRRYERLADAGAATGVIDPLLVRAYLRAGYALPAHRAGDGTPHSGAALHLFATGVARRVVKADVASLYPSLMRAYRIGPARDHLGAMLALVDRLVERRLAAKNAARAAAPGSPERFLQEALSSAMKLVVNSAYGYLGAGGGLTRFADVHAANEVTRRGRETLALMCSELELRGVTLLEADTDGVYFSVPEDWTLDAERRVVCEVDTLLPELVHLEFEGRYAAMLSHEPKNYALLTYSNELILRGVAFRSSRAEPFGEIFLRRAARCLLDGDIGGVREVYLSTLDSLRKRKLPTHQVASKVRLTKTAAQYRATRQIRRELAYEAMLASGRTEWSIGDRVHVYRTKTGGRVADLDGGQDPRDYDVERYARLLRESFATRLSRAFTPEDYAAVFAEPDQLTLFSPSVDTIRTVLHPVTVTLSGIQARVP